MVHSFCLALYKHWHWAIASLTTVNCKFKSYIRNASSYISYIIIVNGKYSECGDCAWSHVSTPHRYIGIRRIRQVLVGGWRHRGALLCRWWYWWCLSDCDHGHLSTTLFIMVITIVRWHGRLVSGVHLGDWRCSVATRRVTRSWSHPFLET